jgi:catechol 2,3-dioxygenase-like lactoylglutathione lyase family enzyme
MKRYILLLGIVTGAICLLITFSAKSQSTKPTISMKLNAGIVTEKLAVTKRFYQDVLNFGITFENEFYLLLHTPGKQAELGFLLPNHPTQQPIFRQPFSGNGMFLTIEVADVDVQYQRMKKLGVPIEIEIRDEPWGDRHFAVVDPNGIGIDIVTYKPN